MIGNSSSGIIEAPAFGVPTVNIGARQLGRLAAESIVHCAANEDAILDAIDLVLTPAFRASARHVRNPYGQGNAAARIVEVIEHHSSTFTKHFHDLESGYEH